MSVYILSSNGAHQLQVRYIGTLENIQENLSIEGAVLKCILINFFLEIWRSLRRTAKKLALENYVLAYDKADKDHAKML